MPCETCEKGPNVKPTVSTVATTTTTKPKMLTRVIKRPPVDIEFEDLSYVIGKELVCYFCVLVIMEH